MFAVFRLKNEQVTYLGCVFAASAAAAKTLVQTKRPDIPPAELRAAPATIVATVPFAVVE